MFISIRLGICIEAKPSNDHLSNGRGVR